MIYVIVNGEGKFLALPEGKRHGSREEIEAHKPEWTSLDHAARFDSEIGARSTILGLVIARRFPGRVADIQVITLDAAWEVAS